MSIFLDRKYLLQVSHKLSKFTKKNDNLFNFRCPFCGDSQKDKKKTRGYVYHKKNSYFYMCHNCGLSISFYNFLDRLDGSLAKEYSLEKFTNGDTKGSNTPQPDVQEVKSKPVFYDKLNLETVDSLPEEHFAKKYVVGRQIPESFHSQLYFAPDFKKFVESLGIEKDGLKEDDQRLIIPFFYKNRIVGYTARTINSNQNPRYLSEQQPGYVFNLDRQTWERKFVVVCEGPIDAISIDACAILGAEIKKSQDYELRRLNKEIVWVPDRDHEGPKTVEQALNFEWSVSMPDWPEGIKDINDAVCKIGRLATLYLIVQAKESNPLKIRLKAKTWFNGVKEK